MWTRKGKCEIWGEGKKWLKIVGKVNQSNAIGYLGSVEGPFEMGSTLIYDHESALLKDFLQQFLTINASAEKEII